MNREEAEAFVLSKSMPMNFGDFYESDVDDLVDKIYDDIESRTCENCKHYEMYMPQNNMHDQYNRMDCTANDAGQNIVSYPPPTFGCNKFERRTDV